MLTQKNDWRTAAAGIAVAVIFGLSFLATKTALNRLDSIDLLALRFTLAATGLILLIIMGWVRVDLSGRRWVTLIPLTIFQPITYFLCETWGVKLTSPSESGMIIGSIPVIVTVLAAILLNERPTKVQSLFILFSFTGVAVIVAGGGRIGGSHLTGFLLLFGAALSAGLYNILSRRHSQRFAPVEITLVMMIIGALGFNGSSLIIHGPIRWLATYRLLGQISIGLPLLYLGILSSIIAFFLLNFMLSRVEAARAAAYINLTTVVAVVAGVFLNGDPLHAFHAIGGILILLGVWGANRFRSVNAQ